MQWTAPPRIGAVRIGTPTTSRPDAAPSLHAGERDHRADVGRYELPLNGRDVNLVRGHGEMSRVGQVGLVVW